MAEAIKAREEEVEEEDTEQEVEEAVDRHPLGETPTQREDRVKRLSSLTSL